MRDETELKILVHSKSSDSKIQTLASDRIDGHFEHQDTEDGCGV